LRLDPCMHRRMVNFAPAWPERYGPLEVRSLRLDGYRAGLMVGEDGARLSGLSSEIRVDYHPRSALTAIGPHPVDHTG
jgi:hypothetical protein